MSRGLVCVVCGGLTWPAGAAIQGLSLAGSLPGADVSTVYATYAPGEADLLYVVEQSGLIQTLDLTTGTFASTPFLDIRTLIDDTAPEQGLLGLAFDPNFHNNGYV